MKNICKLIYHTSVIIGCLLFTAGCEKNTSETNDRDTSGLSLLFETTLNIGEPSGIAFSKSMNKLWIVSGGDQHVYMIDTSGVIQKKLSFIGTDLEGIALDPTDSTLWVVDEATKLISHLDLDGTLLHQTYLTYQTQLSNKGPEGITIGENKSLCVINEKDPSIIVKMNSDFVTLSIDTLNFALDYSDIWHVSADTFFIVSDESEAVYLWSKSKGIIKKYLLPNAKNEGIALDERNNIIYIVNDANAKLYCYRLDTTVVN